MKTKITFLLYFLMVLVFNQVNAQGENMIWQFGRHSALDFRSGSPLMDSGFIYTACGCASISDASGNFLFSTDGNHVYDRLGNDMPGTFTGSLLGHTFSTTSAIIVPMPCSNHLYYIFCVDAQTGMQVEGVTTDTTRIRYGGVSYNIVDMNLRGGLGDVISLNNLLLNYTPEKLTIVNHSNGRDFWAVTREWNTNKFYSYLVSPSGIAPPVITPIGDIRLNSDITHYFGNNRILNSLSYLVTSPNNKMIASAIYLQIDTTVSVELYDINNTTGVLSNYRILNSEYASTYGVCFSPNSELLYAYGTNNNDTAKISQWDLLSGIIDTSRIDFIFPRSFYSEAEESGAMMCGPDNKIYFSCPDSGVGVINSPNIRGLLCDVNPNTINFSGTKVLLGLPYQCNFKTLIGNQFIKDTIIICGDSINILIDSNYWNILWNDGDTNFYHTFYNSGKYWNRVESYCGIFYDTIVLIFNHDSLKLVNDTTICYGKIFNLHPNHAFPNYHWSNGSTLHDININTEGTYILTVTSVLGCTFIDSTYINYTPNTTSDLLHDTTICLYDTFLYSIPNRYTSYLWQDLSILNTNLINHNGLYHLIVCDSFGCYYSDTMLVQNFTTPSEILGSDILKCKTTIANFELYANYSDILWSDGSTLHNHDIQNPGSYYVILRDTNGCKFSDTIIITNSPEPIIYLGNDTTKCFYDHINLVVNNVPFGSTIIWQDGISSGTTRNINTPAIYIANYYDSYGCLGKDTQIITDFPLTNLDLPMLLSKCRDSELVINAPSNFATYNWNTGQHSASITTTDTGWLLLQAIDSFNCIYSDSTLIKNKILNNPLLGSNRTLCEGETISLSPGLFEKYIWNTGDSISTLDITTSGYYSVIISNGCADTSIGVQINFIVCDDRIAIPSAFSPNGDGINDFFFPHFDFFYKLEEFSVFNRWGEKVYSSLDTPWDGSYKSREQGTNTFVYHVILHNTYKNEKVYKNGEVTLIK